MDIDTNEIKVFKLLSRAHGYKNKLYISTNKYKNTEVFFLGKVMTYAHGPEQIPVCIAMVRHADSEIHNQKYWFTDKQQSVTPRLVPNVSVQRYYL